MIEGSARPVAASRSHSSFPFISGRLTSTIRQAFRAGSDAASRALGEGKASTLKPEARNNLVSPLRTEASSSTTMTVGGGSRLRFASVSFALDRRDRRRSRSGFAACLFNILLFSRHSPVRHYFRIDPHASSIRPKCRVEDRPASYFVHKLWVGGGRSFDPNLSLSKRLGQLG
jgi:hypothetical protein